MSEWDYITLVVQANVGVVLNTLALLVILRTGNLHNKTNYLLAYLAVVDAMYCLGLILANTTAEIQLPVIVIRHEIFCRIVGSFFIYTLTGYSSCYGLCLVTYERYIGIVHPLLYARLLSAKKVTLIIVMTWMMSVLFSSPRLFTMTADGGTNLTNCTEVSGGYDTLEEIRAMFFILFGYLLPILFMSWAYYKIQAALKESAQLQQNVQAAARRLLQARQNVIHMLRIVIGALVVLWTPIVLLRIICLPKHQVTEWCQSNSYSLLNVLFNCLYNVNSMINPIIYVFKYEKFRKGLQDVLCCCYGRRRRPTSNDVQIAITDRNVLETSMALTHAP